MARIDAFLKLGLDQDCSDIHLAVGVPPMLRMHGDLLPIKFRDLTAQELDAYMDEILTTNQKKTFSSGSDLDFSYKTEEGGRYRVNLYRKATGIGATFRNIPTEVPTLEQLNLPPICKTLCDNHQGMVLVTGSTGTGKSTTLAAMIDYINRTRSTNIISLEDPIEFVHKPYKAQVIQREIGTHLPSFADGIRASLREDPDVIMVGEMRDAETISMAMTAAETGHLVFGTLHTTGAVKTIDRIVDALPCDQKEQTKSFLSASLKAVLTQTLIKTPEGKGRRACLEVLVMTRAIGNLIKTDQVHQIASQMQTGQDHGMQLMDQALLEAVTRKEADPDDAVRFATDKSLFEKFVTEATSSHKISALTP
jgi:twitching motility protein PilT